MLSMSNKLENRELSQTILELIWDSGNSESMITTVCHRVIELDQDIFRNDALHSKLAKLLFKYTQNYCFI